ncbi:hypothetical protein ElyMa_005177000 [Elysia marginata]|uniref:Uncharacterized protein n=1 Tax=Elysia marginata TaxID=1093978 RepID=A0AAV4JR50_9GAST|nr:hypothetical protein ElyMa_005177000 [Elysia marginata]
MAPSPFPSVSLARACPGRHIRFHGVSDRLDIGAMFILDCRHGTPPRGAGTCKHKVSLALRDTDILNNLGQPVVACTLRSRLAHTLPPLDPQECTTKTRRLFVVYATPQSGEARTTVPAAQRVKKSQLATHASHYDKLEKKYPSNGCFVLRMSALKFKSRLYLLTWGGFLACE